MNRLLLAATSTIAVVALALSSGGAGIADVRALPFSITETHLSRSEFAEPSIALSSKDHVYFCGPNGFPGGMNGFIRSEDWATFERTNIFDRTGGGDCDVKVGADDAVYTANLQLWASAVRKSIDGGKTFTYQTTEDPVEQDRQWLATDPVDPNIVYLAYHDWTIGAIIVAKSIDGGATFLIHSVASTDPIPLVRGAKMTFPGPLRVDPTNHERLYMVWSVADVTDCTAQSTCPFLDHRFVMVGRSENGGLTWTNHVAIEAPPGSSMSEIIPWMSVDAAGNPSVAAAGWIAGPGGARTNGLFLAASTDKGEHWTGPVKVNEGDGAVAFPTVVSGKDGVANFAWIQSTAPTSDVTGEWRVHFAQSRDATAATPSFQRVTGPLIHKGNVCTLGLLCVAGGDRSLLDFMDMTLDSFGYVHMAVSSTVPSQHVLYWRQDAGPSSTSEPCAVEGEEDCVTVRPGPRA